MRIGYRPYMRPIQIIRIPCGHIRNTGKQRTGESVAVQLVRRMPVVVTSESRLAACAVALVSLTGFLFAQSPIGADEMSLHAAPYTPPSSSATFRTQV